MGCGCGKRQAKKKRTGTTTGPKKLLSSVKSAYDYKIQKNTKPHKYGR